MTACRFTLTMIPSRGFAPRHVAVPEDYSFGGLAAVILAAFEIPGDVRWAFDMGEGTFVTDSMEGDVELVRAKEILPAGTPIPNEAGDYLYLTCGRNSQWDIAVVCGGPDRRLRPVPRIYAFSGRTVAFAFRDMNPLAELTYACDVPEHPRHSEAVEEEARLGIREADFRRVSRAVESVTAEPVMNTIGSVEGRVRLRVQEYFADPSGAFDLEFPGDATLYDLEAALRERCRYDTDDIINIRVHGARLVSMLGEFEPYPDGWEHLSPSCEIGRLRGFDLELKAGYPPRSFSIRFVGRCGRSSPSHAHGSEAPVHDRRPRFGVVRFGREWSDTLLGDPGPEQILDSAVRGNLDGDQSQARRARS